MTTISYSRPIDRPVRIQVDGGSIEADWTMPMDAQGVVIFAHGSGSSRFSRRNRIVTRELYDRKLGSLLVDLLTSDEEHEDMLTAALRFDVKLLSERLIAAATWVKGQPDSAFLPVGFFATGVGAAAALHAAACRPNLVDAIVSRGGRPDLAGVALHRVKTPTLLIAAGDDVQGLALNRWTYWRLDCERKLEVIRGATHRFEERGAMEKTTALAMEWFDVHLPSRPTSFSLPRTTSAYALHG